MIYRLSALLAISALLSGCSSFPRDSYIRDGKITTLWGTVSVSAAATGAAAKNLTQEERAVLLQGPLPAR